jgi:hypothetical protein
MSKSLIVFATAAAMAPWTRERVLHPAQRAGTQTANASIE